MLQVYRALYRVDSAAKLNEDAISRKFEDTALMLGNERCLNLLPPGLECGQRIGLVLLHEPTITNHIGSQNCSEAAFHDNLPALGQPAHTCEFLGLSYHYS
jgi:hypothetical protein